jgi:hypothetical protein
MNLEGNKRMNKYKANVILTLKMILYIFS